MSKIQPNNQFDSNLCKYVKAHCRNQQKFKLVHSYLYSFSLDKLSDSINQFQFAYFFCNYYQINVQPNDHTVFRNNQQPNQASAFRKTCDQLLQLCQRTILKFYNSLPKEEKFNGVLERLRSYLSIRVTQSDKLLENVISPNDDLNENQLKHQIIQDNQLQVPQKIILPIKLKKFQKLIK
eukprot:403376117